MTVLSPIDSDGHPDGGSEGILGVLSVPERAGTAWRSGCPKEAEVVDDDDGKFLPGIGAELSRVDELLVVPAPP